MSKLTTVKGLKDTTKSGLSKVVPTTDLADEVSSIDTALQNIEKQITSTQEKLTLAGISERDVEKVNDNRGFIKRLLGLKENQGLITGTLSLMGRPAEALQGLLAAQNLGINPLHAAWQGLHGDKEYSLKDLGFDFGADSGAGVLVNAALNMMFEAYADPFNFLSLGVVDFIKGKGKGYTSQALQKIGGWMSKTPEGEYLWNSLQDKYNLLTDFFKKTFGTWKNQFYGDFKNEVSNLRSVQIREQSTLQTLLRENLSRLDELADDLTAGFTGKKFDGTTRELLSDADRQDIIQTLELDDDFIKNIDGDVDQISEARTQLYNKLSTYVTRKMEEQFFHGYSLGDMFDSLLDYGIIEPAAKTVEDVNKSEIWKVVMEALDWARYSNEKYKVYKIEDLVSVKKFIKKREHLGKEILDAFGNPVTSEALHTQGYAIQLTDIGKEVFGNYYGKVKQTQLISRLRAGLSVEKQINNMNQLLADGRLTLNIHNEEDLQFVEDFKELYQTMFNRELLIVERRLPNDYFELIFAPNQKAYDYWNQITDTERALVDYLDEWQPKLSEFDKKVERKLELETEKQEIVDELIDSLMTNPEDIVEFGKDADFSLEQFNQELINPYREILAERSKSTENGLWNLYTPGVASPTSFGLTMKGLEEWVSVAKQINPERLIYGPFKLLINDYTRAGNTWFVPVEITWDTMSLAERANVLGYMLERNIISFEDLEAANIFSFKDMSKTKNLNAVIGNRFNIVASSNSRTPSLLNLSEWNIGNVEQTLDQIDINIDLGLESILNGRLIQDETLETLANEFSRTQTHNWLFRNKDRLNDTAKAAMDRVEEIRAELTPLRTQITRTIKNNKIDEIRALSDTVKSGFWEGWENTKVGSLIAQIRKDYGPHDFDDALLDEIENLSRQSYRTDGRLAILEEELSEVYGVFDLPTVKPVVDFLNLRNNTNTPSLDVIKSAVENDQRLYAFKSKSGQNIYTTTKPDLEDYVEISKDLRNHIADYYTKSQQVRLFKSSANDLADAVAELNIVLFMNRHPDMQFNLDSLAALKEQEVARWSNELTGELVSNYEPEFKNQEVKYQIQKLTNEIENNKRILGDKQQVANNLNQQASIIRRELLVPVVSGVQYDEAGRVLSFSKLKFYEKQKAAKYLEHYELRSKVDKQLLELSNKQEALANELEVKKVALDESKKTSDDLQTGLNKAEKQLSTHINKLNKEVEGKIRNYQSAIESQTTPVATVRRQTSKKGRKTEAERLGFGNDETKKSFEYATRKPIQVEDEIKKVTSQLEQTTDKEEIKTLKKKLDSLTKELEKSKEAWDKEYPKMLKKFDDADAYAAESKKKLSDLQKKLEDLQQQKIDFEKFIAENPTAEKFVTFYESGRRKYNSVEDFGNTIIKKIEQTTNDIRNATNLVNREVGLFTEYKDYMDGKFKVLDELLILLDDIDATADDILAKFNSNKPITLLEAEKLKMEIIPLVQEREALTAAQRFIKQSTVGNEYKLGKSTYEKIANELVIDKGSYKGMSVAEIQQKAAQAAADYNIKNQEFIKLSEEHAKIPDEMAKIQKEMEDEIAWTEGVAKKRVSDSTKTIETLNNRAATNKQKQVEKDTASLQKVDESITSTTEEIAKTESDIADLHEKKEFIDLHTAAVKAAPQRISSLKQILKDPETAFVKARNEWTNTFQDGVNSLSSDIDFDSIFYLENKNKPGVKEFKTEYNAIKKNFEEKSTVPYKKVKEVVEYEKEFGRNIVAEEFEKEYQEYYDQVYEEQYPTWLESPEVQQRINDEFDGDIDLFENHIITSPDKDYKEFTDGLVEYIAEEKPEWFERRLRKEVRTEIKEKNVKVSESKATLEALMNTYNKSPDFTLTNFVKNNLSEERLNYIKELEPKLRELAKKTVLLTEMEALGLTTAHVLEYSSVKNMLKKFDNLNGKKGDLLAPTYDSPFYSDFRNYVRYLKENFDIDYDSMLASSKHGIRDTRLARAAESLKSDGGWVYRPEDVAKPIAPKVTTNRVYETQDVGKRFPKRKQEGPAYELIRYAELDENYPSSGMYEDAWDWYKHLSRLDDRTPGNKRPYGTVSFDKLLKKLDLDDVDDLYFDELLDTKQGEKIYDSIVKFNWTNGAVQDALAKEFKWTLLDNSEFIIPPEYSLTPSDYFSAKEIQKLQNNLGENWAEFIEADPQAFGLQGFLTTAEYNPDKAKQALDILYKKKTQEAKALGVSENQVKLDTFKYEAQLAYYNRNEVKKSITSLRNNIIQADKKAIEPVYLDLLNNYFKDAVKNPDKAYKNLMKKVEALVVNNKKPLGYDDAFKEFERLPELLKQYIDFDNQYINNQANFQKLQDEMRSAYVKKFGEQTKDKAEDLEEYLEDVELSDLGVGTITQTKGIQSTAWMKDLDKAKDGFQTPQDILGFYLQAKNNHLSKSYDGRIAAAQKVIDGYKNYTPKQAAPKKIKPEKWADQVIVGELQYRVQGKSLRQFWVRKGREGNYRFEVVENGLVPQSDLMSKLKTDARQKAKKYYDDMMKYEDKPTGAAYKNAARNYNWWASYDELASSLEKAWTETFKKGVKNPDKKRKDILLQVFTFNLDNVKKQRDLYVSNLNATFMKEATQVDRFLDGAKLPNKIFKQLETNATNKIKQQTTELEKIPVKISRIKRAVITLPAQLGKKYANMSIDKVLAKLDDMKIKAYSKGREAGIVWEMQYGDVWNQLKAASNDIYDLNLLQDALTESNKQINAMMEHLTQKQSIRTEQTKDFLEFIDNTEKELGEALELNTTIKDKVNDFVKELKEKRYKSNVNKVNRLQTKLEKLNEQRTAAQDKLTKSEAKTEHDYLTDNDKKLLSDNIEKQKKNQERVDMFERTRAARLEDYDRISAYQEIKKLEDQERLAQLKEYETEEKAVLKEIDGITENNKGLQASLDKINEIENPPKLEGGGVVGFTERVQENSEVPTATFTDPLSEADLLWKNQQYTQPVKRDIEFITRLLSKQKTLSTFQPEIRLLPEVFQSTVDRLVNVQETINASIARLFREYIDVDMENWEVAGYMRHMLTPEMASLSAITRTLSQNYTGVTAEVFGKNAKKLMYHREYQASAYDVNKMMAEDLFNTNPIQVTAMALDILPQQFMLGALFKNLFDNNMLRKVNLADKQIDRTGINALKEKLQKEIDNLSLVKNPTPYQLSQIKEKQKLQDVANKYLELWDQQKTLEETFGLKKDVPSIVDNWLEQEGLDRSAIKNAADKRGEVTLASLTDELFRLKKELAFAQQRGWTDDINRLKEAIANQNKLITYTKETTEVNLSEEQLAQLTDLDRQMAKLLPELQAAQSKGFTGKDSWLRDNPIYGKEYMWVDKGIVEELRNSFNLIATAADFKELTESGWSKPMMEMFNDLENGTPYAIHKGAFTLLQRYAKQARSNEGKIIWETLQKWVVAPFKRFSVFSVGFHVRNILTNYVNGYLAGFNPMDLHREIWSCQRELQQFDSMLKDIDKVLATGEFRTAEEQLALFQPDENGLGFFARGYKSDKYGIDIVGNAEKQRIWDEYFNMLELGVIGNNMFNSDLVTMMGHLRDKVYGKQTKVNLKGFNKLTKSVSDRMKNVADYSFKFSKMMDDGGKIAMYRLLTRPEYADKYKHLLTDMDFLSDAAKEAAEGLELSPEDMLNRSASRYVKFALFDYNDLTPTEETVMRTLFPFYTWTRKNLEFQLKNFAKREKRYFKLSNMLEGWRNGFIDDEDEESDYAANYIPIFKSNGVITYLKMDMPFKSADDILSGDGIVNALTPVIKTPLEMITGYDFFTRKTLNTHGVAPGIGLGLTGMIRTMNIVTHQIFNNYNPTYEDKKLAGAIGSKVMQAISVIKNFLTLKDTINDDGAVAGLTGLIPSVFSNADIQQTIYYNKRDRLEQMQKALRYYTKNNE